MNLKRGFGSATVLNGKLKTERIAPNLMNNVGVYVCLSACSNPTVEWIAMCESLTAARVKMVVLCVLVPIHWYTGL
jgi:hypothetical protein